MRILVKKFGGTSVANLECMKRVQKKVEEGLDQGYKILAVLSARAGDTNKLLDLAQQWSDDPDPAELDVLVSTGEQVSISLFTMLLKDSGIKARSMLGDQAGIITDDSYGQARIKEIDKDKILSFFNEYDVLVIAGFQGVTECGRITTLGRGGSDTSAVALAAATSAVQCDIFTDVEGVYTTDPNLCTKARKLDQVSYDEMLEMASMGAKVLEIRSVEFAKKYNVPVRVLSTFSDAPGTLVTQEDSDMEDIMVSSIAYDKNQARVTLSSVRDKPGIASAIFGPLAASNISVDMIIQNPSCDGVTDMSFTVTRKDLKRARIIMEKICNDIGGANVGFDDSIAKVSIIGVGMRNHSGVAALAFESLKKENINILMISTSEIKISCLIEEKYLELAVRVLHDTFGLDSDSYKEQKNSSEA